MQKVKMWWLREGREFLEGHSNLTATSLRSDKHGTSHSPDHDAIAIMPPIEGPYASIEEWAQTPPPPIVGNDYDQFAIFEEFNFWPVARDLSDELGISEKHEDALSFYGLSHRLNAVAKASENPKGHPMRDPLNWGIAFFIAVTGSVAAALAINLGGLM